MYVIFYLHGTGLCGGIRIVLSLCHYLDQIPGWKCELWTPPAPYPQWFGKPIRHRSFNSLAELGEHARITRAHKVATWWETASWVAETIKEGDKGFYLVQDIETTYAWNTTQRAKVLQTYHKGLTPLCTSKWVVQQLNDVVHSEVPAQYIGIGIDFDKFNPLPMIRERYRILCPYRPSAGHNDLKGWHAARVAAKRCQEIVPETSLVTFGVDPKPPDVPEGLPHVHLQRISDLKLRELYSQSGVFLMPSNHEGFGLTAAEAMACGCPIVTTPCEGNEEFCLNRETCLVGPKGNGKKLGELCAEVMNEPELAAIRTEKAKTFINQYTWESVIERCKSTILHETSSGVAV